MRQRLELNFPVAIFGFETTTAFVFITSFTTIGSIIAIEPLIFFDLKIWS